MKAMKYDIYKGTKKEMDQGFGELMFENCSNTTIIKFCKKYGIPTGKFLDGDYIKGYWLEEAM